ncbi:hypothetical protein ABTD98_22365, partial [Acinetobacter baumannii]
SRARFIPDATNIAEAAQHQNAGYSVNSLAKRGANKVSTAASVKNKEQRGWLISGPFQAMKRETIMPALTKA